MAKKGFGNLIAAKRVAAGLTPEELGERLGRTKGIVYRLESEAQEPNAEVINALVSILPMSTEELLRGMGIALAPSFGDKLPRRLLQLIMEMTPEQHLTLLTLLEGLMAREEARR